MVVRGYDIDTSSIVEPVSGCCGVVGMAVVVALSGAVRPWCVSAYYLMMFNCKCGCCLAVFTTLLFWVILVVGEDLLSIDWRVRRVRDIPNYSCARNMEYSIT